MVEQGLKTWQSFSRVCTLTALWYYQCKMEYWGEGQLICGDLGHFCSKYKGENKVLGIA